MNKYFTLDETLVASELWDFLSGQENTMEQILQIINAIATTDFLEKYKFLKTNENRNKPEYKEILDDWFLCSEKELIINDQRIRNSIENNRTLTRTKHNKKEPESGFKSKNKNRCK